MTAVLALAEPIRIATYNVSLGRKGPGLLLRDLEKGADDQIRVVQQIIARAAPDILLMNDFDYDHGNVALNLFADQLAEIGVALPYRFALRPNAGWQTGLDLDGDGRTGGPGDSQGYGEFSGSQGMALLSRFAIDVEGVQDFTPLLWNDLPGAIMPASSSADAVSDIQRLSSKGHWVVPVRLPDGRVLHLFAVHATPPVFDGPEDRNGLRNRDEIRFWSLYLNGMITPGAKSTRFVILGDLNADPMDGEGAKTAIRALLAHPLINDVQPQSNGAKAASSRQGGPNTTHSTDPGLDTVDWDETRVPGNMRVDYVLPSADLKVLGAGVFWPAPGEEGFDLVGSNGDVGSHHRLVWIDIE